MSGSKEEHLEDINLLDIDDDINDQNNFKPNSAHKMLDLINMTQERMVQEPHDPYFEEENKYEDQFLKSKQHKLSELSELSQLNKNKELYPELPAKENKNVFSMNSPNLNQEERHLIDLDEDHFLIKLEKEKEEEFNGWGSNFQADKVNLPDPIPKQKHEIETQTDDDSISSVPQGVVKNEYMDNRFVAIQEPVTVNDGYLTSYKLYTILTKLNEERSGYDTRVRRRFSDFEWLYEVLVKNYPGYIIPLLPKKNLFTNFNFESTNFSENRRKELVIFLQKLLFHHWLKYTKEVFEFLTYDEKEFSLIKCNEEIVDNPMNKAAKGLLGAINEVSAFIKENIISQQPPGFVKKEDQGDMEFQNFWSYFTNIELKMTVLLNDLTILQNYRKSKKKNLCIIHHCLSDIAEAYKMREHTSGYDKFFKCSENFIAHFREYENEQRDFDDDVISKLQEWVRNSSAVKESLRRRKELDDEVQLDWGRIEEIKLQNAKLNNRRDTELDLLTQKHERNKKKLDLMSKILLKEINEYKQQADVELDIVFLNFTRIQMKALNINC